MRLSTVTPSGFPHPFKGEDGDAHPLDSLLQAGSAHSLSEPMEVGGRWWLFCGCGWLFSADTVEDIPARCDRERIIQEARWTLDMADRIARRERDELAKLLRRAR